LILEIGFTIIPCSSTHKKSTNEDTISSSSRWGDGENWKMDIFAYSKVLSNHDRFTFYLHFTTRLQEVILKSFVNAYWSNAFTRQKSYSPSTCLLLQKCGLQSFPMNFILLNITIHRTMSQMLCLIKRYHQFCIWSEADTNSLQHKKIYMFAYINN